MLQHILHSPLQPAPLQGPDHFIFIVVIVLITRDPSDDPPPHQL